VLARNDNN